MHVEKRYLEIVAQTMPCKKHQIEAVLKMLEEGNTVPFIARYRKERTGSLDEVQIKDISDEYQRVEKIEKKRSDIEARIGELGKLTENLKKSIDAAETMQQLEDLYLPYKQKRRTKAQAAKEAGLEPFALWMLTFQKETVESKAKAVVRKLGLKEEKTAIDGAMEILAENFGENPQTRQMVRDLADNRGKIVAARKKNAEDAQEVYKNYYEFEALAKKLTSYQVLALDRGEKQGVLRVRLELDDERILNQMYRHYAKNHEEDSAEYVKKACNDAYKRFIKPAIERELRSNLTETADKKAIEVFGDNLYHLLMQAPLKGRVVLG
ncbi:Tex-like N-terminal domain-containing protein, partial [Ligilactobacillus ruminis]|uniref:Tex-like N-terminal domain-containing protein n=1 Tax=Ligilactobacillus ruminis TaxID=1623 RepID=UPI00325ACCEB